MEGFLEPPPQPPKRAQKKKKNHKAMIGGLVPKSDFLRGDFRPIHFMKKPPTYAKTRCDRDLRDCRAMMINYFHRDIGGPVKESFKDGPTTRSSVEEVDDWVIDEDAYNLTTTYHRRLSCYPLEQLLISERNTKLLLLASY